MLEPNAAPQMRNRLVTNRNMENVLSVSRIIAAIPAMSEADRVQTRQNAGRRRFEGTPAQQEAAELVLSALDNYEADSRRKVRDRLSGMNEVERLKEAFTVLPPTETEEKVLRALIKNPGSTSAELSAACAWRGQAWHLHFGTMCFNRELYLWPAEQSLSNDEKFYSGILATYDEATHTFTMKPEIASAFAEIGVRA